MRVWLNRLAYAGGTLVALVLVVIGCIYGISEHRFNKTHVVADETISVLSLRRERRLKLPLRAVVWRSRWMTGRW